MTGEGGPGQKCVRVKSVFIVDLGSHSSLSEKRNDVKSPVSSVNQSVGDCTVARHAQGSADRCVLLAYISKFGLIF